MSAADLGRLVLLAAVWGLAFVFIRVAVMPLGPVAQPLATSNTAPPMTRMKALTVAPATPGGR